MTTTATLVHESKTAPVVTISIQEGDKSVEFNVTKDLTKVSKGHVIYTTDEFVLRVLADWAFDGLYDIKEHGTAYDRYYTYHGTWA